MNGDKAYLSNDKDMIKFQYGIKSFDFVGHIRWKGLRL